MKHIFAMVAVLAVATGIATAQGTCPCRAYLPDERCDVLSIVDTTPERLCVVNQALCNGCRCVTAGETPTGVCSLAAATTLYFTGPQTNPGPCGFRGFEFAECPDVTLPPPTAAPTGIPPTPTGAPNSFTVNCGESSAYPDSFTCVLPTSTIQKSFSMSCQMQITWSSNFTATFTNVNPDPQTADITVFENHFMFVEDIAESQNLYFTLTSGSVDWADDISVTQSCVDIGFQETCQVSSVQTQTTSAYESTGDFSLDVDAASNLGTQDVTLRFQYQASGAAVDFQQSRLSAYTDIRVLVCEYVTTRR